MHNENWNDYLYFLKVCDHGTLQAAAHQLGVNHSTVFRRINSLEQRLNVRLFERLKTGYQLTRAGEEIIERVRQVEEQMDTIYRVVHGQDIELSGTLKISTTDTLGYFWLPRYIKQFQELYPDIVIDIDIKTRYTNLSKREADIVIPAVNKQPDYMVGRVLRAITFLLCGSRPYLADFGQPAGVEDLGAHRYILPNESLAGLPANKWLRQYIEPQSIVACSDKLTGLHALARQGLGLTILPAYVVDQDPELLALFPLPKDCRHQVWILTHPDLRYTGRVKAFMQFMYDQMERETREERGDEGSVSL